MHQLGLACAHRSRPGRACVAVSWAGLTVSWSSPPAVSQCPAPNAPARLCQCRVPSAPRAHASPCRAPSAPHAHACPCLAPLPAHPVCIAIQTAFLMRFLLQYTRVYCNTVPINPTPGHNTINCIAIQFLQQPGCLYCNTLDHLAIQFLLKPATFQPI